MSYNLRSNKRKFFCEEEKQNKLPEFELFKIIINEVIDLVDDENRQKNIEDLETISVTSSTSDIDQYENEEEKTNDCWRQFIIKKDCNKCINYGNLVESIVGQEVCNYFEHKYLHNTIKNEYCLFC